MTKLFLCIFILSIFISCEENKSADSNIFQIGTKKNESGRAIISDNYGNVYITGYSEGNLDQNINFGESDVFLMKVDNNGYKKWVKQFGTNSYDIGTSVLIDEIGNIFVGGYTWGNLNENINMGSSDSFLTKFDQNGNIIWTKQWGTRFEDRCYSIKLDKSENIYLLGYSETEFNEETNSGDRNIFLVKYNKDGILQWTKEFGSIDFDEGTSIAIDTNENIYITGYTWGDIVENIYSDTNGSDIFLMKLDSNGNNIWVKQFNSIGTQIGYSVITDNEDNIFLEGITESSFENNLHIGFSDVVLMKFDSNGNNLWTKEFGSNSYDEGKSIIIDNQKNIFIVGNTQGSFNEFENKGKRDIFLTKLDNLGNIIWTKQWGTNNHDNGNSVTINNNKIFITGDTEGELNNKKNNGEKDMFLMILNE